MQANLAIVGMTVAYTGTFVLSAQLPKDVADLKGEIIELRGIGTKLARAIIRRQDGEQSTALLCYLCPVKSTAHINSDLPQSVH